MLTAGVSVPEDDEELRVPDRRWWLEPLRPFGPIVMPDVSQIRSVELRCWLLVTDAVWSAMLRSRIARSPREDSLGGGPTVAGIHGIPPAATSLYELL